MKRIYPYNDDDDVDEIIEAYIIENKCETCLHRKNDDCWWVENGLLLRGEWVSGCSHYKKEGMKDEIENHINRE